MNIQAAISIQGKIIFLRISFIYVFCPKNTPQGIWPALSDMHSLAEKKY